MNLNIHRGSDVDKAGSGLGVAFSGIDGYVF